MQWIVFDKVTAEATQHSGLVEERHEGGVAEALQEAARDSRTVVLVVPGIGEKATVARISPVVRGA